MYWLNNHYNFVFAGGSCGSFVKTIWNFYNAYIYNNQIINRHYKVDYKVVPKIKLHVNETTGDAHDNIMCYQQFHDHNVLHVKNNDPDKKIILIMFDHDDIDLITKLQYFKFNKPWLENNLDLAKSLYPAIADGLSDPARCEETWREHLKQGYQHWLKHVDSENADFIIDFKTIYRESDKNLNQIISSYLKTDTRPEVDSYINKYRQINYKLYGE